MTRPSVLAAPPPTPPSRGGGPLHTYAPAAAAPPPFFAPPAGQLAIARGRGLRASLSLRGHTSPPRRGLTHPPPPPMPLPRGLRYRFAAPCPVHHPPSHVRRCRPHRHTQFPPASQSGAIAPPTPQGRHTGPRPGGQTPPRPRSVCALLTPRPPPVLPESSLRLPLRSGAPHCAPGRGRLAFLRHCTATAPHCHIRCTPRPCLRFAPAAAS